MASTRTPPTLSHGRCLHTGQHGSGDGNGAAQLLTVYGRVQPQTTPSPGVYTDTVVVIVTY
ncbi:spore coat protein U domain-containing protein [Rhizobium sullae]|nr:spore coat protein U domain-containing protein [Rhizobium sullae]UWU14363.1 spore coat protein U domain-containing protein [Rhizobium sullae]